MNLFILLRGKDGEKELVTPPLSTGVILPGVTRRSIIELTQTWPELKVTERKITMGEVMTAQEEGRLLEMFGSGTAAVVSPVGGLHYGGKLHSLPTPEDGLAVRIMAAMSDIYYGKVASPWAIDVEEWNVDRTQVFSQLHAFNAEVLILLCRSWKIISSLRRQGPKAPLIISPVIFPCKGNGVSYGCDG